MEKLITTKINEMPNYVLQNLQKYKPWLDIKVKFYENLRLFYVF